MTANTIFMRMRFIKKAHELLWEMVGKGEFLQETAECYYVYELVMNGRSQAGIVACASVDDYCTR